MTKSKNSNPSRSIIKTLAAASLERNDIGVSRLYQRAATEYAKRGDFRTAASYAQLSVDLCSRALAKEFAGIANGVRRIAKIIFSDKNKYRSDATADVILRALIKASSWYRIGGKGDRAIRAEWGEYTGHLCANGQHGVVANVLPI